MKHRLTFVQIIIQIERLLWCFLRRYLSSYSVLGGLFLLIFWTQTSQAQQRYSPQRDMTEPLETLEAELAQVARLILRHDSLPYKHELNKQFIKRMEIILNRPDSYDFPFSALETVSRILPQDNSFRIFTWTMYDADKEKTYHNSIYFGFIQRRWISPTTKISHLIVTQLHDKVGNFATVENTILTPKDWFGALYYQPRHSKHGVQSYKGKYREMDGMTGKKKTKHITYYVLFGLNQNNLSTNFKVIDVITFDPIDSTTILFGAPIFVTRAVPAVRRVFQYADNSPFTLNIGHFTTRSLGLFNRKHEGIVFDHLITPKFKKDLQLSQTGTDGSYDALIYIRRVFDQRKGIFITARNVKVFTPGMEHLTPAKLRRQAKKNKAVYY
jgi:hypothetical protein